MNSSKTLAIKTMLKPHKYVLYSKCCDAAVYRLGKIIHCQSCQQPATFRRQPIDYISLPISKKHEDKKLVDFPAYKPVWGLSQSARSEEAIKRRQVITDYEAIKPTDTTEIKFIKQRIKWNNDRIALLLG